MDKRKLGQTGFEATIMGLGGEGILRTFGHEEEAYRLINRALDLGINYMESASAYSGSEAYYGLALKERRKDVFLASKSHARIKNEARKQLEETLQNMKTDHLDLWQMHDVRTEADVLRIFGPGGAYEAFLEAKEQGLARFIGITGHEDPDIIRYCIERHQFDTVLIPVNPAEPQFKSFLAGVIPAAQRKRMGIIGMKIYCRGLAERVRVARGLEKFFQFALSLPVTTAVIGCDNLEQLEQNVIFAERFLPIGEAKRTELINQVAPFAQDLMYYKAIELNR